MQKYLLAPLILSVLALPTLAQNKNPDDERRPQRPVFTDIDTNEDGNIELSEFSALPHKHDDYESLFNRIDANEDGVISAQEFTEHKPPRNRRRDKGDAQ